MTRPYKCPDCDELCEPWTDELRSCGHRRARNISQPLSRVIGDGAPLTPEERAEIEATARAATPGRWRVETYDPKSPAAVEGEGPRSPWICDVYTGERGKVASAFADHTQDPDEQHVANARHIARMDPPTTLRLLAALAAAEARAEAERASRKAEEEVWLGAIGQRDEATMARLRAARKVEHDKLRALGVEP